MSVPRYAVYYAPAPGTALWRFGSGVLGYDAASGDEPEPLTTAGLGRDIWRALTAEPRRYGFHATLKAPFRLREGARAEALAEACRRFAAQHEAVTLDGLEVATFGRFLGLVAKAENAALDRLAADVVMAFDGFRAPLTEAERAKRLKAGLSARQRAYLETYGYPHVLDEFRFHMTLTGALDPDLVPRVRDALAEAYLAETGDGPVEIDGIALFRQDGPEARFRIVESFAFPTKPGIAEARGAAG